MSDQRLEQGTVPRKTLSWLVLGLTFFPLVLFLFLCLLNPGYMARMWRSTCGCLASVTVLGMMGLTFVALLWLGPLLRQVSVPRWVSHRETLEGLLVVIVAVLLVLPAVLVVLFVPAVLLLMEANILAQ